MPFDPNNLNQVWYTRACAIANQGDNIASSLPGCLHEKYIEALYEEIEQYEHNKNVNLAPIQESNKRSRSDSVVLMEQE